jgi:dipeptidyl-peptidase-4
MMTETTHRDTFPRQYARTQRFTLGEPRTFSVSADGNRVIYLRSRSGSDPVNCLWEYDLTTSSERIIVDPLVDANDAGDLSPEEKARRERLREAGSGITSYSVDKHARVYAFALSGQLYVGDFASGTTTHIETNGPVFDPRLDPTGTRIAFVIDGELVTVDLDAADPKLRTIAGRSVFGESETVAWGVADFIAAEEMGRYRGFWWSPNGQRVAVARVDESPVQQWTISDPSQPSVPAHSVRYPAAGSNNARVGISMFDVADSTSPSIPQRDVEWDVSLYPYLADLHWISDESIHVTVQTRDQRTVVIGRARWDEPQVVSVQVETSDTWVDLVPGSPASLSNGTIVSVADRDGVKRLLIGGSPVTPDSVDVRHIIAADDDAVVFVAIDTMRPESWTIWSWDTSTSTLRQLSGSDGVHSASVGGSTLVLRRSSVTMRRASVSIRSLDDPFAVLADIDSMSEIPLVEPNVRFLRAGSRGIPCAVILPKHVPAGSRLPVLMDPYGGPHAQRVVDSYAAHCTSQWFADQGFAVIVADGRGTPGLGTEWERSIHHDLATAVLDDQVEALTSVAHEYDFIDTNRVAIRGWSFGGYLSALAVLRRPDVFHAAVAGAPVTDWRLYDTHYTERYLGDPNVDDSPYERTSLIALADRLTRPLLLIHGLADDNVVAAHTLQLSAALLAAGKPHEVLPLSGVTHMTPQAVVAENLLLHQLDFVRRSLDLQ